MNQSKIQLEFGVSSGDAFQVEGWPRFSDWYDWTHQTDKIKDYSNANEATQFWQRYRDDIELAKKVGAKVFKISIAWDRIESSPGEWDLAAFDTYRKMIDGIHECGMSAVVCLQSYVLPRWLAKLGGTCSEDFPWRFADYAEKVIQHLGPVCRDSTLWLTFSRPVGWATRSYGKRQWPPGERNFSDILLASSLITKAHFEAVNKMRTASSKALQISYLQGVWDVSPKNRLNPLDWVMKTFFEKYFNNKFYRVLNTNRNTWSLPGVRTHRTELCEIKSGHEMDYIALSFEGRLKVSFRVLPPFFNVSECRDPHVLPNLFSMLKPFRKAPLPIQFLQFSSVAPTDQLQADFMVAFVAHIKKCLLKGLKIKTLLYGPFTDCFEWHQGFAVKRGLIEIEPETFQRQPKFSFEAYKEIIRSESRSSLPSEG